MLSALLEQFGGIGCNCWWLAIISSLASQLMSPAVHSLRGTPVTVQWCCFSLIGSSVIEEEEKLDEHVTGCSLPL